MAEKIGTSCLMKSRCKGENSARDGGLACLRGLPAQEVVGCTAAAAMDVRASDGLLADWTFHAIDGYAIKCPILEVSRTRTLNQTLILSPGPDPGPDTITDSDPEPT